MMPQQQTLKKNELRTDLHRRHSSAFVPLLPPRRAGFHGPAAFSVLPGVRTTDINLVNFNVFVRHFIPYLPLKTKLRVGCRNGRV